MQPFDVEGSRRVLAAEGFGDLDTDRTVRFLFLLAEALRAAPLRSFEDANDRLGTANGVASGIVRSTIEELATLGYVDLRPAHDICLTKRGANAARLLGVVTD